MSTIAFDAYHATNPHILPKLAELAMQVRRTGRVHFSIKALFERLRWDYLFTTEGDSFKLNNNYHAHYARLLMTTYPELSGFFHVRERKGQVSMNYGS